MMNQTASQRARASSLDASTLLILLAESSSLPAFGAAGHQVLAEFTVPSGQSNFTRALLLGLSAESQALELDGSAVTIVPLKAMIRESLACLNADVRREFGRFLCSVSGAFPHPSQTLHQSLHTLREALRERLPLVAPEPGQTRGLTVHNILAITDISFYVSGAVSDIAPLCRLTAVSPEGQRVELLQSASRFDPVGRGAAGVLDRDGEVREKPGFAAFFELPAPSLLTRGAGRHPIA